MDPAPLQHSPRTTCAWEGGDGPCYSRSPWLKENIYNHDRRFPLRRITQRLQEEAKYLSVLTLPYAEAPFGHRKPFLVQSLPFISEQDLLLTAFFAFLLGLWDCKKIKTVQQLDYRVGALELERDFFFLS